MNPITQKLDAYIATHPFDAGQDDCETVLEQLFLAYQESHESDPPEIKEAFSDLDIFLEPMSFDESSACFALICRLCLAYEHRAFMDGVQYGAHLMRGLSDF